ncbi:MAG: CrcB family protein [Cyanobacteriota bacterium]|nr:CrcB family protein [Cyanobacteriota bacterium]
MKPELRKEILDLGLVGGGAIPGALLRWRLASLDSPLHLEILGVNGLANLIGCLVIGLVLAGAAERPRRFLAVGIGFCGSLTTFSSWMLELTEQLSQGQLAEAWGQLVITLVGGLALTGLGYALGQELKQRRG